MWVHGDPGTVRATEGVGLTACLLQRNSGVCDSFHQSVFTEDFCGPGSQWASPLSASVAESRPLPVHPDFWPTSNLLTFPFTAN